MTADRMALVVGFTVVVAWLSALTLGHRRARRHRGEPVYRRLPDGRLRFEWAIGTAYVAARRNAAPPAGPGPARAPDRRARAVPAAPRERR